MPYWRLTPVADPRDSRWLDHPIWQEVIVRASTAAAARLAAEPLELSDPADPGANPDPARRSGFADEKLYWVRQLSPLEASAFAGEPGPVVKAQLASFQSIG